MHQLTNLISGFTIVLCLAVLVIILLNKTVSRLQKEHSRLSSDKGTRRHLAGQQEPDRKESRWRQVEPMKVAEQVYESGITNLN